MTFPLMPVVPPFSKIPTVTYLAGFPFGNASTRSASSTEANDRFIVYIGSTNTTAVMTSCLINGVAAEVANSGAASFACAYVPTGTTVTAVPTFSVGGTTGSSGMAAMYAVYGLESPIWRSVTYNSGAPSSASIVIPQDGLIFVPVWLNNDNQSPAFTGATRDAEGDNGSSYGWATGHRDASDAGTYTVSVAATATMYMGLGCLR
jgi:hypothetical protein